MEVKKRKGFFFSTDALLALGIFVIALILLLQLRPASAPSFKEPIIADDIIMALSAIRVNETSSPTVKNMISAQEIRPEQLGISIAELLAELWSEDNTIIAEQIIIEVTSTLSSKYQVAFSVNQDDLFGFSEEDSLRTVALGTRIVTGINRSQPTRGYSAHIQFSLPKNRTTSSFAYFGGFSGQGDLEVMLRDLPSDLDSSNIISLSMEAAISQEVTIFVNNNVCGTFPAEPLSKRSQYFNLSSCIPALLPGYNRVRLSFEELETAFVGGGFVQVKYTTNEIAVPTVGQGTYHFPDIYGIINVYDSITIPGNLTSLEIYLEYDALIPPNVETTYFLNIGNATVYSGTNMTSESVTLTDADFSMLDYSSMSGTIPIRMGIEGVNYSGYVTVDNPSDTIIITDLSGSMAWCGDTEPPLTCTYDCRYQMWFWQFTTEKSCQVESVDACAGDVCGGTPTCTSTSNHDACRPRVEIAKEAALIAQDLILTNELARVGLIAYSTGIVS